MKRLFLILFLLLFLGMAYADGPRYRFKSRRALQSLWRKEMKENPKGYYGNGRSRNLNQREQFGEGLDEKADKFQYGVVVSDPFSDVKLGDGNDENDGEDNGFYASKVVRGGKIVDGGSGGLRPYIPPGVDPTPPNPFVTGQTGSGQGKGFGETPNPPVGDGLHIMIILSAALVVIKKRLSK